MALVTANAVAQYQEASVVRLASPSVTLPALSKPDMSFDVNLVLVPVAVTDPKNRPVLGLTKEAFTLYEDKRAEKIQYFFNEDTPIAVGLVVDFSSSMESKADTLREAIRQFFDAANPQDEYYVVVVSTHPKLIANGTKDVHEIEDKLAHEQPFGWTALLDGVDLAMRMMKSSQYERKVVVMISDGGENNSRLHLQRVRSMVAEQNADVYGVGIFENVIPFFRPLEEKLGGRTMARLTDATGGRLIAVNNASQLPQAVSDLSEEIRNQYVLGYRPRNMKHDGRWRKIRVEVKAPVDSMRLRASYKNKYFPGGR